MSNVETGDLPAIAWADLGGDNLGDHTATQDVDMGGFSPTNAASAGFAADNTVSAQTVTASKIAAWDDEAGIGGTNNAKYMVFEIPLDTAGLYGATDFEIKIEEVTNTTTEWNMVYYWQSMGDPWDGNNTTWGDTNARCYFIDSHQASAPLSLDIRKQQLYTNLTAGVDSTSLYSRLNHVDSRIETVLFYPSHDGCYTDWTTWQWYTNAHNLRASWVRYDALGPETNSVGNQVWHPIKIDWVPKRQGEAPLPQG